MTRPFQWYHKFWTCDIDRDLWPTFENFTLAITFLCRLWSIATHRDHFVRRLSVRLSVCLSHSHSYVSQATHAFLGMLPLFLVHLSRRLKCTIVITRCLSSVVCRPSVVNFSHFRLLLWNRWTEFNETWQEARTQHPLPSLCFSGRSEKQDGRPGLWLAETFSTSSLKPLNRNSTKLDRKQDLNLLYQVCVFWADRRNKMAAMASDLLRHFWLLLWNRWTEFNKTWHEARSQLPVPGLCFSGRSEKQDGRPCLWLAETFLTSPLKPLTEFNKTWQEARSQRPVPGLCFLGRSEKQDGRPGLWLAETFLTSPLKPLNGIQQNLTGSKISTSCTRFVFFGPIGKTRWPLWPLIGWDIFDFSSETTEPNSTKLDRK